LNIVKVLVGVVILLTTNNVFAIPTVSKIVDTIGIQGSSADEIVITNNLGWGAEGCESAKLVVLASSLYNRQAMLSLILSAKMSNMKVIFYGGCDATNINRFKASYVVLN
jgi:hypothetical protein